MSSMMDEMQKTLARRRAKVDRGSEEPEDGRDKSASPGKADRQGGSESPKPGKRRTFGSVDIDQEIKVNGIDGNVSCTELEAVKQEILKEMRKEVNKAKQEIIEVIRAEISKR